MEKKFSELTLAIKVPIPKDDLEVQNNKREWILLPTIMYKVLLPVLQNKQLNLFQQTILRLLRTGYKSEQQLAKLLSLDEELVHYIIAELQEMEYISNKLIITEKGINFLKGIQDDAKSKLCYMFYDVITKQFWDVVYTEEQLEYYDMRPKGKNFTINFGTLEKPREREVMVLYESQNAALEEVRPEHLYQTMLAASERSLNIEKMPNGSRNQYMFKTDRATMTSANLISNGDPVYLATFMYVPSNIKENSNWQVMYPFGYTDASQLRDELVKKSLLNKKLQQKIDYLLKGALEVSTLEMQDEAYKQSYHYMINLFGEHIARNANILQHGMDLITAYEKLIALQNEKNIGAVFEDLQMEFSAFIVKTQEFIECAFIEQINRYVKQKKRVNDTEEKLQILNFIHKDAQSNVTMLHAYAEKCGFAISHNSADYNQLLKVNFGDVKYAIENKKLKGLLAQMLIYGGEGKILSIKKVADRFPTFIDFLMELQLMRNASGHITEDNFHTQIAPDIFTKVTFTVSLLFNTLYNIDSIDEFGQLDEASLMANRKLRVLSMQEVQNKFGKLLEKQTLLEKYLVEMRYFKGAYSEHFVMKCVSVIEYLLNAMLETASYYDVNDLLEKKPLDHLNRYAPLLQQLGFLFNIDALPDSFKNIKVEKVRLDLYALKKSVPNVKLYALFALMSKNDPSMWQHIAQKVPYLFETMISYIDLRKHGNVKVEEMEREKMEECIFELVKVIIPVIESKSGVQ